MENNLLNKTIVGNVPHASFLTTRYGSLDISANLERMLNRNNSIAVGSQNKDKSCKLNTSNKYIPYSSIGVNFGPTISSLAHIKSKYASNTIPRVS